MGWFRARRIVCDPTGQEWELFVSRAAPPGWKPAGGGSLGSVAPATLPGVEFTLLAIPLAFVDFLWSCVIVPSLRFVFLMPVALVRGRRSRVARIEAMCFYPEPETRTWATTLDQVDSVLDEIARGIEEGKLAQPTGAVYLGSHEG